MMIGAAEDGGASLVPGRSVSDQLASVEIDVLIDRAQEHQGKNEHDLAVGRLQEARMRAERTAFPDKKDVIAQIDELLVQAESLRRDAELAEYSGRRHLAQERAIGLRDQHQQAKRSRFEERLRRIIDLRERQLFELALAQCRLLVSDFPEHELARETYRRLLEDVHRQRNLDTEERMRALKQELSDEMARSLIPRGFDGVPIFPDDWDRRSQRQAGTVGDELPIMNASILNLLTTRISVAFDELEPAECVDLLAGRVKVNMVVDAEVRANPEATVTLNARNMRIDNVLDWIAQQAGVQWRIQNDAIFVTLQEETEVFTRIYDVGNLLYSAPDFAGVEIGFNSGEDGLAAFDMDLTDEDGGLAPEDLTDIITMTLGEEMWEREGHGLSVYGTQLIATCTPELHAQLQSFISRFHQADDIQVNVRARWLALNKTFVEEIGVDWQDLETNPIFDAANFPFPMPPMTDNGQLGWFGDGGDNFNAGNIVNNLPGSGIADIVAPSLGTSGLSLTYGLLGTWQVAATLRAVEQDRQGRFVQAVEVTTRNGAMANAFVGRSIAYVSDYDLVVGGGVSEAAVYDPVISIMNIGAAIEVRPLVSADRKYVTLDLEPILVDGDLSTTTVDALGTIQFQNGNVITIIYFPIELDIQVPTIEIARSHTRVMIPDGGSVLVGGLKRSRRESSKAQVPVLGNIPFLGRLFSRRGRYELDENLYLMASVKIFLYQELEAQQ